MARLSRGGSISSLPKSGGGEKPAISRARLQNSESLDSDTIITLDVINAMRYHFL